MLEPIIFLLNLLPFPPRFSRHPYVIYVAGKMNLPVAQLCKALHRLSWALRYPPDRFLPGSCQAFPAFGPTVAATPGGKREMIPKTRRTYNILYCIVFTSMLIT